MNNNARLAEELRQLQSLFDSYKSGKNLEREKLVKERDEARYLYDELAKATAMQRDRFKDLHEQVRMLVSGSGPEARMLEHLTALSMMLQRLETHARAAGIL